VSRAPAICSESADAISLSFPFYNSIANQPKIALSEQGETLGDTAKVEGGSLYLCSGVLYLCSGSLPSANVEGDAAKVEDIVPNGPRISPQQHNTQHATHSKQQTTKHNNTQHTTHNPRQTQQTTHIT